MAKRNRYREFENLMTKIIAGDAFAFVLYLIFAGCGWAVLKGLVAVLVAIVSVLALAWLFLNKEMFRRRSLWLVTGFAAILICLLASLALKYPCPRVIL